MLARRHQVRVGITFLSFPFPLPWHLKPNRRIQVALFRARSGHNRLNYSAGRWKQEISRKCTYGCPDLEDAEHVVLNCLHLEQYRAPLRSFLRRNSLTLDWATVFGLNQDIPSNLQHHIQHQLGSFLSASGLLDRL